jgi:hypothetical protein
LLGGGTAGVTGAVSTGAFDAVAGDRLFDVETATDENALLGIDIDERSGRAGGTITLLELTNRFDEPLETISVTLDQSDQRMIGTIQTPDRLDPGETGAVEADLTCNRNRADDLTISISASTADESVTATRSVRVSCVASTPVCDPRSPTGCVDTALPGPPRRRTDCSVVLDTGGDDFQENVVGNTAIGGALEVNAAETDLSIRGSASIGDHVRIDSTGEIDFDVGGAATVGGVLQFDSPGAVTATVVTDIGDGLCAKSGDVVDVTVRGASTLDGDVSVESGDEAIVDMAGGSTATGALEIDAEGEITASIDGDSTVGNVTAVTADGVSLAVAGDSRIDGNARLESEDEVTVTLDGNERILGDLTVDAEGETTLDLRGSSKITGDVTIDSEGEIEVKLFGNSSIDGDLSVESDDDIQVTIGGSSSIGGDVTLEGDESSVSDCSAVEGEVSPQSAC